MPIYLNIANGCFRFWWIRHVGRKKNRRFLTIIGKLISQFVTEAALDVTWAATLPFGLTARANLAKIRDE